MKLYHYDPKTHKFNGQVSEAKISKETGLHVIPDHATPFEPPTFAAAQFVVHEWRIEVYHYRADTMEYIETTQEPFDPINRLPLVPAHATLCYPLCGFGNEFERPVFNPVTQDWWLVSDYRGIWFDAEGGEHLILELGDKKPAYLLWTRERPPPTPEKIIAGIRREAARRIAASGHDWKVTKALSTGKKPPKAVVEYAESVRAASNTLEKTLPLDWTDDQHWPERIEA